MGYPQCVVCHLNLENPEYHTFICPNPKCKRRYILDYEVLSYSDSVGTAYDEDTNIEMAGIGAGGPGLSTSDRELDFKTPEEEAEERYNGKDKIRIPKYMKDGQVTTVEEYHEE